ncbi:glycosyltransferase family 4 protein [Alicyclobacillus pomorum]|jgi:glycosyltransferase involved in cell wall biosynthesis|uniref:glycosyltransferase family 4 protein n=1 Tax=Alicyclobacillus pomorum TaxID=204470 RepID=UPI000404F4A4|nr:glycosyltransferase family 1 protein [Alicyclobacillus pomorum]
MRIAMFTETFLPGTDGIVTRLCATLKHLHAAGHEVLLFAPEGGPETYESARVVGLPSFSFFLYPEKKFAFPRRKIGRALKAFDPDLIHVVNPAFLGLGGIYYAKRFHLPLVASYHTNVPTYARHYGMSWLEPALWWYFRTLHNFADVNLCTSKAMLQELEVHRFRNLGLWERGVDVERYANAKRSEEMRHRLCGGDSTNKKILLYVGRLAPEKGIERLRPCLDQFPDVCLAIVGDGPHRAQLERVFQGTQTVFTGYLHGAELAEAYASADGFVFPSTTETLGLVLFEAMASHLPVMAADSLPTREVLEDGDAGVIFNPEQTEDMCRAIQLLLYDASVRERVRRRADELVRGVDWAAPTQQLLNHYEQLLSRRVPLASEVVRQSRS